MKKSHIKSLNEEIERVLNEEDIPAHSIANSVYLKLLLKKKQHYENQEGKSYSDSKTTSVNCNCRFKNA